MYCYHQQKAGGCLRIYTVKSPDARKFTSLFIFETETTDKLYEIAMREQNNVTGKNREHGLVGNMD